MTAAIVLLLLVFFLALLYAGRPFLAWFLTGLAAHLAWAARGAHPVMLFRTTSVILWALGALFGIRAIRRRVVSPMLMKILAGALPRMGETERIALEAGTVWWDGELFSGAPRWRRLLDFKPKPLSERERAFLSGPAEELCRMITDWGVQKRQDLPAEAWEFLKRNRFFGMIIPEEYGGLGFSAQAHSAVVTKLASRSVTAAVTVMVPNSLGPAELLLHYGTDEQKKHFLPRLASGIEVPCFALTEPEAGSDAASGKSTGVVCRGVFEGREVLGMRLRWSKRYITLGPVATILGLAFRLRDPDHLLGDREEIGITCALIPPDLPGIEFKMRHDPLGVPFQNGPTTGHDVFVPIDCIIGGQPMAGQGWRMLMDCLAAGRGISLPALSVGAAQLSTRVTGAYATVREQFDLPIGRFEGIEEPLARIGGLTYLMNGARTLTAAAVDAGEKPAVLSAVMKAYLTEAMRTVVNAAMDIQAGAGISRGPRNTLAGAYMALPIGITVEGANILTRSLIIYGQGAIRCHPHVRAEMDAVARRDVDAFDRALFGHLGFVARNVARAWIGGITGGRIGRPAVAGPLGDALGRFSRMSAAFAVISDACMATLGGQLKRREKLSGRLADALAWLYLGSAAAKRFWDEGRTPRDLPFLQWSCEHALFEIQRALVGVLDNLPNRPVAWALRAIVFPLGARQRPPNDALAGRVARALLEDREERLHLTRDIHVPPSTDEGLGRLEAALDRVMRAAPVQAKIRTAMRAGRLERAPEGTLLDRAVAAGVLNQEEASTLRDAEAARDEVIQVDAFDPETFASPLA
jgi:acyl-CoA dehydrogenase